MSTKIVVVQIKDIIKKAVFVLAAAAALIAIIGFLASKGSKTSYIPGTYSSEIMLNGSPVILEVTVDKASITDMALLNLSETQEVFYPLMEPSFTTVRNEILEKQTTDISADENTVTSSIIIDAVNSALAQARLNDKETTQESE